MNQDIQIFSETFGNSKNPAIILNAGAGNQAITWDKEFCNKLALQGYFVIRYDYRDTGISSIEYEKHSYNILDLTDDAIDLLKKYHIKRAYFLGFSMGGQISQFAAAYRPEYIKGIILIGTSTDFKPGFDAFEGKFHKQSLSHPDIKYVDWVLNSPDLKNASLNEKIDHYVKTWQILDGMPKNFDKKFFHNQAMEVLTRSAKDNPYQFHAKAMKDSFKLHQAAPSLIKCPALIIQGEKDPVFPIDHGQDLATKISNSKLIILKDFAHAISPQHFDQIINIIDQFIHSIK